MDNLHLVSVSSNKEARTAMAIEYNFYFVAKLINATKKAKAESCPKSLRSRVPGELIFGSGVDDIGDNDIVGDAVKHQSYSSK